jgi:hypothetical protein
MELVIPVYSCTHWLRPRNLSVELDLQCLLLCVQLYSLAESPQLKYGVRFPMFTPVYSCTVPTHWLRPRNLNMELDLQCILLCTAVLIGSRPRNLSVVLDLQCLLMCTALFIA